MTSKQTSLIRYPVWVGFILTTVVVIWMILPGGAPFALGGAASSPADYSHTPITQIPGRLKQMTEEAHRLYRAGKPMQATTIFTQLGEQAPDTPEGVDAWRMLGQIQLAVSPRLAIGSYERAARILESTTNPAVIRIRPVFLSEVLSKLAYAQQECGMFEAALQTRRRLRVSGEDAVSLSARERFNQILQDARANLQLGRINQALSGFDLAITMFPETGLDPVRIVDLKCERIRAKGREDSDPAELTEREALWNNAEYRDFLSILGVGNNLAFLYERMGALEKHAEITEELLSRLRPAMQTASDHEKTLYGLELFYRQNLIGLAGTRTRQGDHAAAIALYQEYIENFPDDPLSCDPQEMIDHLSE